MDEGKIHEVPRQGSAPFESIRMTHVDYTFVRKHISAVACPAVYYIFSILYTNKLRATRGPRPQILGDVTSLVGCRGLVGDMIMQI